MQSNLETKQPAATHFILSLPAPRVQGKEKQKKKKVKRAKKVGTDGAGKNNIIVYLSGVRW